MSVKCIVFDLDGTIADTIGGIAHSCNYVLEHYGYPTHALEEYKKIVGYGLRKALYDALPENVTQTTEITSPLISQYVDELSDFYEIHYLHDTRVYAGIDLLLDYLESRNIQWCVHTNKKESIAKSIVNVLFLNRCHCGVVGLSDTYPAKPETPGTLALIQGFDRSEVILVGDTEVDIFTAQNLGVPSFSVTWGFRSKEFLEKYDTILIENPLDLISYLE